MKAIILAAGKATRLLPLTKEVPQSMLKISDKTILEIQVENLRKASIEDITVVTGHLSEKLEKFCNEIGVKTMFNPFYDVSGMALTLWIAKEYLKDGFLLLYSDVLFNPEIIKGSLKEKNAMCLAIKKDNLRSEAEKVVEKEGIIKNVGKAKVDEENGEFIGIAKFSTVGSKKLIRELDNISKINLDASFIELINNLIQKEERITAYDIKNSQFIDIDFPDDLEKAKKIFS